MKDRKKTHSKSGGKEGMNEKASERVPEKDEGPRRESLQRTEKSLKWTWSIVLGPWWLSW